MVYLQTSKSSSKDTKDSKDSKSNKDKEKESKEAAGDGAHVDAVIIFFVHFRGISYS